MSGNNLVRADSSAFWGNMLFACFLYYFSYKYIKLSRINVCLDYPFYSMYSHAHIYFWVLIKFASTWTHNT